ncbi:hypothetical protein ABIC07_008397 [Bradyrhizobium sp. RT9a]
MKRRPDAKRHSAGDASLKNACPLLGTPWAPLPHLVVNCESSCDGAEHACHDATTPKTRGSTKGGKRSVAGLAAELAVGETTMRRWRGRGSRRRLAACAKDPANQFEGDRRVAGPQLRLFCADRLFCTDLPCGSAPTRENSVGVSDIFCRMRPPMRRQSRPCFAKSEDSIAEFAATASSDRLFRRLPSPAFARAVPCTHQGNAIGRVKAPSRSRSPPPTIDLRLSFPTRGVATPLSINSSARRGGAAAIQR